MSPDASTLAYWLLKNINRAIYEHGMIPSGSKVAVAVSGGKDSLALLKLLDLRRQSVAEPYTLAAIHVLGDGRGPLEPHAPLVRWLEASGVEYALVPAALPEDEALPMKCRRCAWNRRKALFTAAQKMGCAVLAMGHHADDLAQTTLLNLLYHGKVETMLPRREFFGGEITLVRPLCYTRESEIARYAKLAGFPPPPPDCPESPRSRRALVRDLLRQINREIPGARVNLMRAGLQPSTPGPFSQAWEKGEEE